MVDSENHQAKRGNGVIRRTLNALVLSVVLVALGPGVVRVQAATLVGIAECEMIRAAELAWYAALHEDISAVSCQIAGDGRTVASVSDEPASSTSAATIDAATFPEKSLAAPILVKSASAAKTTATPKATVDSNSNGAKPVAATQNALMARYIGPLRDEAPCKATTLNVVAHEDDDILFMNPDVSADISAERCVRTVYLTAGDAGMPADYWLGREAGAKAAYADMAGVANEWQDDRELLDGRFVSVSYLKAKPNISLLFLRLPDGDIRGAGFAASGNQSLAQLLAGAIPEIHTVDDKTQYSLAQLTTMISVLIALDKPADIRTQHADDPADGDHSDHHAAGQLVRLATTTTTSPVAVTQYVGYPIAAMAPNLSETDATRKQQTFLQYARTDGAVCQTMDECLLTTYGNYLGRQYVVQPPVVAVAP